MPSTLILLLAALAAAILGGMLFLAYKLRQVRGARLAEADAALAGKEIRFRHDGANCFGVQSAGATQLRGNGVLTVTDRGIHFLMWVPRREVDIPAAAITGIERVRAHLGKTYFCDLLKVSYTNAEGLPDSAAWFVVPLDGAEAAVRGLG